MVVLQTLMISVNGYLIQSTSIIHFWHTTYGKGYDFQFIVEWLVAHGVPHAGGTTAYRGTSSGWPMEEALCEATLKGCAE